MIRFWRVASPWFVVLLAVSCGKPEAIVPQAPVAPRPSILLVTLDTTRFDSIGPDARNVQTPAFNALAARGSRFVQAYATAPQTLPSHTSMLTGLYPGGHGVHENGRYLSSVHQLIAERLQAAGYSTAAFVSAFALSRRFGLARGFKTYDDETPPGGAERSSAGTTDRVLTYLKSEQQSPAFVWVHYYDPHYPYAPPEPFRSRYAATPYLGEIAAMDAQLGRLVKAFEESTKGPHAIVIVGDHGEGLGDHGEAQHGNLLYQSTMHVPLLVIGPDVRPGTIAVPVSTRRIFDTLLDWAGLGGSTSLRRAGAEVVAGEAMKPFLDYGWQPQVMAVEGRYKAILSGSLEVYDVVADPAETRDLAASASLSRTARATLRDYPLPDLTPAKSEGAMSDEDRKKLASLGYVSSETRPVVRKDAPRAAAMTSLFELLDKASGLFVREQYAAAIPLLQAILKRDPQNLDASLRLAVAHSSLGHDGEALEAFSRARAIAPASQDVKTYLALHYAKGPGWQQAVPLLEEIVRESPDRLPALEALAQVRERQHRVEDAISLRLRIHSMRTASAAELVHLGEMQMAAGQTEAAITTFEKGRDADRERFRSDLELGVLYLAARRFTEARDALDRVPRDHPGYPMALFKRAQVSVLLNEPDQSDRIARASRGADATTRQLVDSERLFEGKR